LSDVDPYREREVKVKELGQALDQEKFDFEKKKLPLANAAVVVTMIGGLATVGFKAFEAVTARADRDKAAIVAQQDRDDKGFSLFMSTQDKIITCDSQMTDAQVGLFLKEYPHLAPQFQKAADVKRARCSADAANAAAADAQARHAPRGQVEEVADAARYASIVRLTPPTISVLPATQLPTVYIQFSGESQRASALALQTALKAKGYSAPGIQKVVSAPKQAQVRYYHPEQKKIASDAAGVIANALKTNIPTLLPVPGVKNLPQGIIEYWFPAVAS
jgi:hypothetical protein